METQDTAPKPRVATKRPGKAGNAGTKRTPRGYVMTSAEYAATVPAFKTEKQFQAAVIRLAKSLGWTVFFTYRSKNSPPGEPDLRMVKGDRYVLMELKRHNGVVSDAQAEVGQLLAKCRAIEYYLLYDRHWRDGTIDRILRP